MTKDKEIQNGIKTLPSKNKRKEWRKKFKKFF